LAQIRQDNAWQDIPVIIISALDPAEQPTSSMVVATMGQGVSIEKLTRCIQAFSNILLAPA
jgi:CheY-like chemotaxis protein